MSIVTSRATARTPAGTATIGAASAAIVTAQPESRLGVYICNTHATQGLYLSLGGTAVVGSGIYLPPVNGAVYINDYSGAINGIATGASTIVAFSEV